MGLNLERFELPLSPLPKSPLVGNSGRRRASNPTSVLSLDAAVAGPWVGRTVRGRPVLAAAVDSDRAAVQFDEVPADDRPSPLPAPVTSLVVDLHEGAEEKGQGPQTVTERRFTTPTRLCRFLAPDLEHRVVSTQGITGLSGRCLPIPAAPDERFRCTRLPKPCLP
jgi:hypothetical protein